MKKKKNIVITLFVLGLLIGVSDRILVAANAEHQHSPHSCPKWAVAHHCNRPKPDKPPKHESLVRKVQFPEIPDPPSEDQVPDACQCQAACIWGSLMHGPSRTRILMTAFWLR